MKRCPVCNSEFPAAKKFCIKDGTPLVEIAPAAPPVNHEARVFARLASGAIGARLTVYDVGGQREIALDREKLTVGKADDVDLRLDDPSVSRRHAVFTCDVGGWAIIDNNSNHGVYVNGGTIEAAPRRLATGDEIRIGRTRMVFHTAPKTVHPAQVSAPPPPQPARHVADTTSGEGAWVEIEMPTGERSRVVLSPSGSSIGRDPSCDVPLDNPTVSRRQAVIRQTQGGWRIENVGRGRLLRNDAPVGEGGAQLSPGDRLEVGLVRVVFRTERTPAPAVLPTTDRAPAMVAPPPPPAAPRVEPTLLDGRYMLEEKIADTTTGEIYRARRSLLGDRVAIRILKRELVRDPEALERFRRQARVAARIHHPNVVQVYDFNAAADGTVYIVEELLSGRTLRDVVHEQRGLTLVRIAGLLNQICGAVHAAHQNGIILRDLKPDSIFVERAADGREFVKVGGFGLAKITFDSGGVTMAGAARVFGTPQYMSPEQWLGRALDSRSDVYSLGIILFELLMGAPPFNAPAPLVIGEMHQYAPVPNLADLRPDIDEGIAAVVSRALAKDPIQRQPTALHLAAEFEAVTSAAGGLARAIFNKATGRVLVPQPIVGAPLPAQPGEIALPPVVAQPESRGRGPFNAVLLALMAEAVLSRVGSGLVKTAVPLYALLVYGFDITSVMALVLVQNIVPLLLRPTFGSLADRFGKKRVFMISLAARTLVSALYAVLIAPWMFFVVSVVRGISDSAKGPSASAMIADSTDERHIASAFSWYTTIKSTSGGIGEALASFFLVALIVFVTGIQTATVNVAVLERTNTRGESVEQIVASPDEVSANGTLPTPTGEDRVARVEQRQMSIGSVPLDDLPKVIDVDGLKRALILLFALATALSLASLVLVALFLRETKKEKKEKKPGNLVPDTERVAEARPSVWAFAALGAALTAPAYMVTGEFFTVLAVKLEVTPIALGWIKLVSETAVPLVMGPFFGWLADRIGAGKVIALRSLANIATSLLFWITPWFVGTALLAIIMGLARGVDEIGKAAFKPTWGAIAAKVSSFDLARRGRTMGVLEGGVDASDLVFPVVAGMLLQYLSLGWLMAARAVLALVAEVYAIFLTRKYRI